MPAGVRVQQLTPVIRGSSTQPTTFVRFMSPSTSIIRPGTGQQQIIQLNTTKQQQPLVIKAITTSTTNRQQPILLTSNTQSKTILSQNPQQVLVFNQGQGQQQKFTLQMANVEQTNHTNNDNNNQQETTTTTITTENPIPQLDGSVDDQVNIFFFCSYKIYLFVSFVFILAFTKWYIGYDQ